MFSAGLTRLEESHIIRVFARSVTGLEFSAESGVG